jgi:hypothetical protein
VRDFEVRYRLAWAASILQGRFVGQHKDEIYIGRLRESAARCATEENHTDRRILATGVQLRDRINVLLNATRPLPPSAHALY